MFFVVIRWSLLLFVACVDLCCFVLSCVAMCCSSWIFVVLALPLLLFDFMCCSML